LAIRNDLAPLASWDLAECWASGKLGGSPGEAEPPPTADIVDVSPDPRNGPVDSIVIGFDQPVEGFDLADLTLTRGGGPNLLDGSQSLTTSDGQTYTLGNLNAITSSAGAYLLTLVANGSGIVNLFGGPLTADATEGFSVLAAQVVGRHVFYNQSFFDGNNAGATAADDAAIDTTKSALLPGQTAGFANYAAYSRGLNGVMIDITGVNPQVGEEEFLDELVYRVGNNNAPGTWAAGPAPI
jgi:hypothetical protein